MQNDRWLTSKEITLTVCFSALYFVFAFVPISPLVGLPGKAITLAAILAPIMGIVLGPRLGLLSCLLGGILGFFGGIFSPPSLVSGATASVCAGLLRANRRELCAFLYFLMLFFFGFYPFVGPVWLFPAVMWLQVAGLLILVSPIQSIAIRNLEAHNPRILLAFFVTCLTSTLAGQIAGSLTFEIISWPVFLADANAWRFNWQTLTFMYPIERLVIALAASGIGVVLFMVLTAANLMPFKRRRS